MVIEGACDSAVIHTKYSFNVLYDLERYSNLVTQTRFKIQDEFPDNYWRVFCVCFREFSSLRAYRRAGRS